MSASFGSSVVIFVTVPPLKSIPKRTGESAVTCVYASIAKAMSKMISGIAINFFTGYFVMSTFSNKRSISVMYVPSPFIISRSKIKVFLQSSDIL